MRKLLPLLLLIPCLLTGCINDGIRDDITDLNHTAADVTLDTYRQMYFMGANTAYLRLGFDEDTATQFAIDQTDLYFGKDELGVAADD